MLFVHWVDLYWMIFPGAGNHLHHFHMTISEFGTHVATFLGIGGVFMTFFWKRLAGAPVVPLRDPFLKKSINFHNQ